MALCSGTAIAPKPLIQLVRLGGFEPPTKSLGLVHQDCPSLYAAVAKRASTAYLAANPSTGSRAFRQEVAIRALPADSRVP